jgi:phage baseplate assembly protein W
MAIKKTIQDKINKVLGQGFAYPFRFSTSTGGVAMQTTNDETESVQMINASLRVILGVVIREMFMDREFGSFLYLAQDEPINGDLQINIQRYIFDAVEAQEKRIRVSNTYIDTSEQDLGIVNISIQYRILKTYQSGNYVHPFYLGQVV